MWLPGQFPKQIFRTATQSGSVCLSLGQWSLSGQLSGAQGMKYWLYPGGLMAKNLPANAGDGGNVSSIPGSGRSPWGGHGNPLQYSCLKNPMDRGPWWATVHGVTRSQIRLSTHTGDKVSWKQMGCNPGLVVALSVHQYIEWLLCPRYWLGPGTPSWSNTQSPYLHWARSQQGKTTVCAGSLPAWPGLQSSSVWLHQLIIWLTVLSRLLSSRQSETCDLGWSHRTLVCQLKRWKYLLASSLASLVWESEDGREHGCAEQPSALDTGGGATRITQSWGWGHLC